MSQENVEIVRHAFAAFERDGLAGMLPHFDCEICDGKIVRVRNYSDKTQALEAVGLRE
jgi:ketosteroid isomerase-like protein